MALLHRCRAGWRHRRDIAIVVAFVILSSVLCAANATVHSAAATAPERHNVLHIMIDDLRPDIGAYGVPGRHTPTMDALAADGVTFDRAYCQQAVCGPSRNSFLTGTRPDRSRSWNFINSFREDLPDWTTLPGLFLDNGALAYGSGKTYHPKIPPYYDGNKSWSAAALPYFNPCWNTADDPKIPSEFQDGGLPCVPCAVDIEHYVFGKPISVATEMCETDAFEDTFTIERAVHFLQAAASSGKQWYLGVGLHKPHLPFQAAPEDWALHPLNSSTLPTHRVPPVGMPDVAFHFSESSVHSSPWQPLPDNDTLAARRGYAAAATGMDRKLGVLMSALDKLGLANSTAVVLHSDHGWQLGEHGEWRKMTNFELATRVPLIIRAPWVTGPGGGGARASGLVELVDIMPTIAELAGVPLPSGKTYDGTSLVPLLRNGSTTVKAAAFSQYPRHVTNPAEAWDNNGILRCPRSNFTHMGYSVRTRHWRYTEWVRWNGTSLTPLWDEVDGRELYDHRGEPLFPVDFNRYENVNVANATVNVGVVEALSKLLREGFPTVSSVDVSV